MCQTYFHDWSRFQVTAYRKFTRILGVLRLQGLSGSSGRIFLIFVSHNKAVCHEVQIHFLSYPPPKFTKMFWAHFHDYCVQKRSGFPWSPGELWRFSLCKVKKVLGAFSRFLRPKTKVFAVKFRRILEFLCLQVLQKKFWAQFHKLRVQKRSGSLWRSEASWKFSPCKVTEKVLGAFSCFLRAKTKLYAVKFRRIFDVFALHALYKMLWAHFHDLCVQKRSCLPWNSDAFQKFSACKFYRKSSGHNFSICASKNEAVCCEVQTHFGSFALQAL